MKLSTLVALAALAYFAGPTAAQPDPFVRPLPPAAAGTEALGRFLQELGYTPKVLSPDVYQVTVERDRWPVHIMLSLSTDGRRIWLESKFAPVEDPDRVPPQGWKRLLEANEKIGPAHFAFDKSDRRVHLYKSFDNQGLSAARLKAELEHFDTTVRKTQDYWRGDNFKPVIASTDPATGPGKTAALPFQGGSEPSGALPELPALPIASERPDLQALQGAWSVTEIHTKGRKTPDDVVKDRRAGLHLNANRSGKRLPTGGMRVGDGLVGELTISPGRTRAVEARLRGAGQIDLLDEQDRVEQGIYKLEGDSLTLCFAAPGEPRPTEFKTSEQSRNWLIVLRREKK